MGEGFINPGQGRAAPYEAVVRWWIQIPATLRRYSLFLSEAWADGIYLTAWPRLAIVLPALAFVFGLLEGATHISQVNEHSPRLAFAVTFAQMPMLLGAGIVIGALSANAGLMIVLGYAIADYFINAPQFSVPAQWPLHQFFYLRLPQLISYLLFCMVAVTPTLNTRYLVGSLKSLTRIV